MKNQFYSRLFKFCTVVLLTIVTNCSVLANGTGKPTLGTGTYTIGPSGDYSNITNALSGGVTGPVILELLTTYSASSEILTLVTGASAVNTITIRPKAFTSKTYNSSATNPTFQINGGKFYIIDGQAGGVGGGKNLTIQNTGTATNANTSAVRFINDATNNIIRNCILQGQSTVATNGVVLFSTTTVTTGNDNNTITNCDITSSTTLATNGVYSNGTAAKANDANTISNCNIYNIFNATAKSVGILMTANTSSWTISGNSFYQTVSRTTSNVWSAIELNNKASGGNGFTISNNFIGGIVPLAASGTMDFIHTSTGYFSGISIYGFSGAANVVSGNTIKNISVTCNQRNLHYGIYHSDGTVNITGNTIGDLTGTGSIVFNSSAATVSFVSPAFAAICGGGGSTTGTVGGNVNIQNNNIGSITSTATGSGANEFRGIFYQGSAALAAVSVVDISGNTVGGTTANNLYNSGNGATVGIVVNSGYIAGGAKHTIKNNIVQNISSSNSTSPAQGSLEGITTQGIANKDAAYIVENNTIKDLTANNAYTMVGFKTSATIAPQLITKNKVFNLKNASSLVGSNVVGIELGYDFITLPAALSASASELSKNIISNLEMTAATPAVGSVAWGISAYAGRFNIMNNMVAMGYGISNIDITKSYELIGIANNGVGASKLAYFNFYYNTVHVGGAGAISGSPDSKCYYGNNYGSTDLKNNIFYNSRTNAAGATAHYSLLYTNNGTTTSNYNVMSAVGAAGMVAGYYNGATTTNYATTDALFAARAIDENSFSATVKFENNATDLRPVPSPDVANFFIANEALPIVGYTTDIDGNIRNGYFPDMGCYEFKGTGCWIGQVSSAWNNNTVSGNWDDGVVPPSTWDVKIFPKVDPDLTQPIMISSAGIGTVKDLYLRTTSRATTNSSLVTVNTGTLQIYGAVKFRKDAVYSGAIDATLGTIDMKGSSGTQTLSPRWFVKTEIETLTNSNTTGLTIAAPTVGDTMLISKALNYGVGTTGSTIITNDNLTLLSRASGTANFGNMTSNAITGRVNIERYLFGEKSWRFLAAPVQLNASDATTPTVAAAWREGNVSLTATGYGVQITGPTGPTIASPSGELDFKTQRGSMKYYNDAANVWTELSNTTATKIANTQGYMVFVRGDRGAANVTTGAGTPTNLRIKGMIRTGDQTFNVLPNKFQSFGNPYPSRINFATVDKTNITNAFTVWNPTIAGLYNVGGYETYVWDGVSSYKRVGDGAVRNHIESGEAVFVQSNSATAGSVTVKESDKGTGSSLQSRVGVTRPTLEVNMYTKDANGADYLADGVMLNFDNTFSAAIDNMDVRKINNTYDNLAIKNNNYALVVERRPNLVQTDTIKLSIVGMRVATYRLEIDPSVLVYPGLEALLKDKYLQTETPISFSTVTTQSFDITTDAASKAADRFMIVFKPAATTNFTTIAATRNADKTVTVNWGVQNETAVTNYSVEQSNDGVNFTTITTKAAQANNGTNPTYSAMDATATTAANWYRVKANNTNNTVKYTAVAMVAEVQETIQIAEAKMSIYPNPVVDGNVNLHLDNQVKGSYTVQITNAAGQQVKAENVQVENNNTLRIIKLGTKATGTYQLTIKDAAGKTTTIPFIIK
jgi:Secretion system C-terminal sorting domain